MEDLVRLQLRLEFDGAGFCGWQLQSPESEQKQSSVQGALESSLAVVLRQRERRFVVQGCGRTDAGVHAEEFFAHVDLPRAALPTELERERFRHKLNGVLPAGVAVTALGEAPGFHALNDVTSKTYEYRLLIRRAKPALLRGRCLWLPLDPARSEAFDVESVRLALAALEGEHDFVAFAAADFTAQTSVRRLTRCELLDERLHDAAAGGRLLRLRLTGNGFLKQMVRTVAGTLVELGLGKRTVGSVRALLDGPGRRPEAGFCAAPEGLFLMRVEYGPGPRGPGDS